METGFMSSKWRWYKKCSTGGGIALAVIALLVGGCSKTEPSRSTSALGSSQKFNVLLVTLDTTRADHLGCYGHAGGTSPHLDALAADGIRFETAISSAALTPVSHASIMTGLWPCHHGVRVLYAKSGYKLSKNIATLATVLKSSGYKTGAFLSSFPVSQFFGFDNGFDTFDNGLGHPADHVLGEQPDGSWRFDVGANQRRSDETTNQTIAWLDKIQSLSPKSPSTKSPTTKSPTTKSPTTKSPFFLWVHYWDPHDPFITPPRQVVMRFKPSDKTASMETKRRALYDSEIFFVDYQFGRLIQKFKDMGLYDNTVIVVVADHGEGLGDHNHKFHRIIYQEQIHVPLIMRIPGGSKSRVVSDLVRTTDIYPTVLALLGINPPAKVDGLSLVGLMNGKKESPSTKSPSTKSPSTKSPSTKSSLRIAFAEALIMYDLNATSLLKRRPNDGLLYCAMDRDWKLIYRPRLPDKSELYHLHTDPGETTNLYAKEPQQAKRLMTKLQKLSPFVDKPFGAGRDTEAIQRLGSLGYVDHDDADDADQDGNTNDQHDDKK